MSNGSSTLRERTASPLMWHYLGLAALAVLVIGLAVRLGFDLNGSSAETLARQRSSPEGIESANRAAARAGSPRRGVARADAGVLRQEDSRKLLVDRIHPRRTRSEVGGEVDASALCARCAGWRPDRDLDGCGCERGLSADYALCEWAGAEPDLLRGAGDDVDRASRAEW